MYLYRRTSPWSQHRHRVELEFYLDVNTAFSPLNFIFPFLGDNKLHSRSLSSYTHDMCQGLGSPFNIEPFIIPLAFSIPKGHGEILKDLNYDKVQTESRK